jgi:hypothetical protein
MKNSVDANESDGKALPIQNEKDQPHSAIPNKTSFAVRLLSSPK